MGGGGRNSEKLFYIGYEDFCEYLFGVITKIGLYLGVLSMHFRVKIQNGGYFWGLLKYL